MTFDLATFRQVFPEFSDTTKYPDAIVNFWATFVMSIVSQAAWGDQWQMGTFLYVAHEITLAAVNAKVGSIGGTPGGASGPVNSKTVGSVTASYDTQQTAEKDAGYWNLTTYGKQYYRMSRWFGAGCLTV